jgi:L-2-hydroxyglutarate oxidase LhgO
MNQSEIVVIGAGVIGLAIAERLSRKAGREIVLVERQDGFGRETSSRNSEVIHAGFYYPTNSLKARFCIQGRRSLYEILDKNQLPYRQIGKILIGNSEAEITKVHSLYEQGLANGVEGLELVDHRRIREMEPAICGRIGLFSPYTGIFDTHSYLAWLERQCLDRGVTIAYRCRVEGLTRTNRGFQLEIADADGQPMQLSAEVVINSAGLYADQVAGMIGIDIDLAGYRQYYCKGEYFRVSPRHQGKMSRLIYPAPTSHSLGIHVVLGLDGSIRLGPNAFYVKGIDYQIDPEHQQDFFRKAQMYLPFLTQEDLNPDTSGIRPKLQKPGEEAFCDFLIREESDRSLPGLINLLGIESPGLTSSTAIAEHIEGLL